MKILPIESVELLRLHPSDDVRFPNPYDATEEQLRSVDYVTELWPMTGPLLHVSDDRCIVVTFDDLRQSFDGWEQDTDPLLDTDERYATVYDWIRDCIDHGFHPCRTR